MFRVRAVLSCLCLFFVVSVASCAAAEPVLSAEAIEEIQGRLGYALAPTWMPDGFEYIPVANSPIVAERSTGWVYLSFSKIVSMEETADLVMVYPADFGESNSIEQELGQEVPEDAVSAMETNGLAA